MKRLTQTQASLPTALSHNYKNYAKIFEYKRYTLIVFLRLLYPLIHPGHYNTYSPYLTYSIGHPSIPYTPNLQVMLGKVCGWGLVRPIPQLIWQRGGGVSLSGKNPLDLKHPLYNNGRKHKMNTLLQDLMTSLNLLGIKVCIERNGIYHASGVTGVTY